MTSPTGNYSNLVSRTDAAPLAPEQTRKVAGTRAHVRADGAVHADDKHLGYVYRAKSGMAWRARTKSGKQIGLHTSRMEAAGALVRHHGGSC